MENKRAVKEFERWLSAGKPSVFARNEDSGEWGKFSHIDAASIIVNKENVVVDDKLAQVRMRAIDNPELTAQYYCKSESMWFDCGEDCDFELGLIYRFKGEADGMSIGIKMDTNKYIEEAKKWADHLFCAVWVRYDGRWYDTKHPRWENNYFAVVIDDEFAKIRKDFYDGFIICEGSAFNPIVVNEDSFSGSPSKYFRIKENVEYYT